MDEVDDRDGDNAEPVGMPDQLARDHQLRDELDLLAGGRKAKYGRFALAALGSIPWVGGLLGAIANLHSETQQGRIDDLQRQWIEEHRERLNELGCALSEIVKRLEQLGPTVDERLQSEDYLKLVRHGFRTWDQAATAEKRKLVQQLLSNAGGTNVTSDDVVRLFIEWIDHYHEAHFAVIREVHRNPGATRAQIWQTIRGNQPREDSAEADLFKLLIRDLSTGGVIRQHRETDYAGNYIPKKRSKSGGVGSRTMKSAFDDTEEYELTGLGEQFVHYAMNELVPRMGA